MDTVFHIMRFNNCQNCYIQQSYPLKTSKRSTSKSNSFSKNKHPWRSLNKSYTQARKEDSNNHGNSRKTEFRKRNEGTWKLQRITNIQEVNPQSLMCQQNQNQKENQQNWKSKHIPLHNRLKCKWNLNYINCKWK